MIDTNKCNQFIKLDGCIQCVCSVCKKRSSDGKTCTYNNCSFCEPEEEEAHQYCRDLEVDYK